MDVFILRQEIGKVLNEFFNNSWVYTYGQNKFPKFDNSETTPSDLDAEFDEEFLGDELEKNQENIGLNNQIEKVKK